MSLKAPEILKRLAARSRWTLIPYIIAATYRTRIRFASGKIDSFSGSSHSTLTVAQSLGYVNQVFNDFVEYGRLTPDQIRGKRFLELGPGDNVGVGLRFLAQGASQYVCLDKFYSTHDIERERQIYLALREQLTDEEKRNFDAAVKLEPKMEFNRDKTFYVYGMGGQDADKALPGDQFDFILSRGVLQEIYDIDKTFAAMDKLLSPRGMLIHKIDLRDYGMFAGNQFHPREFLTIPDFVYRMMAFDSDKPNRRMANYYRDKMKELGYHAEIYYTGVIEQSGYHGIQREIVPHKKRLEQGIDYSDEHKRMIEAVRPRLAAQFRNLSDEDLLAAAIMLVATKPAQSART